MFGIGLGRRSGARQYVGRVQNFVGQHFWARGYYVSTVGRDEASARKYIRAQENEDQAILLKFARDRRRSAAFAKQIIPPFLIEGGFRLFFG